MEFAPGAVRCRSALKKALGILKPQDLAGHRAHQVFIRNAAHVPPPVEAVRDMMPALFALLETEPDAAVRAVLGHFVFVLTHPYMEGNGRMGRFS
jgi:Fic family protein